MSRKHASKKRSARLKSLHAHVPKTTSIFVITSYILLGAMTGFVIIDKIQQHRKEAAYQYFVDHSARLSVGAKELGVQGSRPFTAPSGKHFIVLDITLRNDSNVAFYLAPVVQTYITDETGKRFDMAPTILDNPIVAGSIAPGKSTSGKVSYLVPISAKNLTYHFVPGTSNGLATQLTLK